MEIESGSVQQTVYIYKCNNSTVRIKGKVNAITMDSCKKCGVVFEDCVAAFEVINCQSMQAQTTGKVNTISIDKTDGAQVYLSEACIGADIITAKSSEMNIMVPNKDDEGQFVRITCARCTQLPRVVLMSWASVVARCAAPRMGLLRG